MSIDAILLQACQKGDRKAQYQLYKSCFSVLMSVCVRYHQNEEDARAILNQGFLKIITNLEKYEPRIPFEAWVRRIMINTIIDEFRRNKKERENISYTDFDAKTSFDEPLDFNEADRLFDAAAIEHLVRQLPQMTQRVFNLFIIDGFSHKEIAKMLDMTEGTSKWHLSNARNLLKTLLQKATEKEKNIRLHT